MTSSGEEKRKTKGKLCRTMMQALELLQLARRHGLGQTMLNSEEIKPISQF